MTSEIRIEQDGNKIEAKSKKGSGALWAVGAVCISAAAVALTSRMVTKTLVSMALDRRMPWIFRDGRIPLNRAVGGDELMKKRQEAAEQLSKLPHEICRIKSHDGETLVGHWFPHPHPRRVIVAMHGWRSSWAADFCAIAGFFYECGCSVLYAEQRGQNDSGGKYMGFGMIERYDCRSWVEYIAPKAGKLPIYLAGISMGAATVLMTAGFSLPEAVKGIIADCGFTSPDAIWRHVVTKNIHLPYRFRAKAAGKLCEKKIAMAPCAYSTLDAMKTCRVPVLFIHGADDGFVPISMTYENYLACHSDKQLLVVPGAGHGVSYLADKKAYEGAVRQFFDRYDGARPID